MMDSSETRPAWAGRLLLSILATLLLLNVAWMVRYCDQLRPAATHGQEAPDFTVRRLSGAPFHLAAARGRPVFVDFWATWCGPCKESLPILDRLYAANKDRGLQVIAIETDGAEAQAKAFADRLHLSLPIGMGTPEMSEKYGVESIPHLVLIDGKGAIRQVFRGVHGEAELQRALDEAGR